MKEQLTQKIKYIPWILLIAVMLSTGVLSSSYNSYRVSLDFNYAELFKIFKDKSKELSED